MKNVDGTTTGLLSGPLAADLAQRDASFILRGSDHVM